MPLGFDLILMLFTGALLDKYFIYAILIAERCSLVNATQTLDQASELLVDLLAPILGIAHGKQTLGVGSGHYKKIGYFLKNWGSTGE